MLSTNQAIVYIGIAFIKIKFKQNKFFNKFIKKLGIMINGVYTNNSITSVCFSSRE